MKLCFFLFGDIPNNIRSYQVTNHARHWNLSPHRSVKFEQSEEQKSNVLEDIFQSILIGENKMFEDLTDYFCFKHEKKMNNFEFLKLLKQQHKEIYYEIAERLW